MTEKEAQAHNPDSSEGWAVDEVVNPDTYPAGELLALEEQKRKDTAAYEDRDNRSPQDLENPGQPGGWGVQAPSGGPIRASREAEVVARVFAKRSTRKYAGSKVLLGTSEEDHQIGEVVAVRDDKFWVSWRDGEDSVEKAANYELVIIEDEAAE